MSSIHPSSFRDSSGFIFTNHGKLYRQINHKYKENYEMLMTGGLYHELLKNNLLIPHKEIDELDFPSLAPDLLYKVIVPEQAQLISYPYEWCFSELKDAALATLKIQQIALSFGMSLKDCSAFNIQFYKGAPVLIDTLSFEKYREGEPWVAYKQFCQHFLGPLALICYNDIRLNQLSKNFIDGVPLDLVSSLLPVKTYLHPGLLIHIHMHAKTQKKYADKEVNIKAVRKMKFTKGAFCGLIENLKNTVDRLKWKYRKTEWGDYYNNTNYSDKSFELKKDIINNYIEEIKPKIVFDLGANNGFFSRLASEKGILTGSFDIDPIAVENNYLCSKKNKEKNILPLIMDLTNPSPSIGWANNERDSFVQRQPADTVLALALIHHLAISNNLPFSRIVQFFSQICKNLIIEFVPKSDSQVKRLLTSREDIFTEYDQAHFESDFVELFEISKSTKIPNTERTLYLMRKRGMS